MPYHDDSLSFYVFNTEVKAEGINTLSNHTNQSKRQNNDKKGQHISQILNTENYKPK